MMDELLYQRLANDAALSALVDDRIYPITAPPEVQQTPPFVVWQVISDVPAVGAVDQESAVATARVQIDSYGASYGQARQVSWAVRMALRDWKSGGVEVTRDNGRALRETDPALKLFRVSDDFLVTFEQ